MIDLLSARECLKDESIARSHAQKYSVLKYCKVIQDKTRLVLERLTKMSLFHLASMQLPFSHFASPARLNSFPNFDWFAHPILDAVVFLRCHCCFNAGQLERHSCLVSSTESDLACATMSDATSSTD